MKKNKVDLHGGRPINQLIQKTSLATKWWRWRIEKWNFDFINFLTLLCVVVTKVDDGMKIRFQKNEVDLLGGRPIIQLIQKPSLETKWWRWRIEKWNFDFINFLTLLCVVVTKVDDGMKIRFQKNEVDLLGGRPIIQWSNFGQRQAWALAAICSTYLSISAERNFKLRHRERFCLVRVVKLLGWQCKIYLSVFCVL